MSNKNQKDVYDLELHEETQISAGKKVLRVPGGWIYTQSLNADAIENFEIVSTTFVPFEEKVKPLKEKVHTTIFKTKLPDGFPKGAD